jgi:hypothetical protein
VRVYGIPIIRSVLFFNRIFERKPWVRRRWRLDSRTRLVSQHLEIPTENLPLDDQSNGATIIQTQGQLPAATQPGRDERDAAVRARRPGGRRVPLISSRYVEIRTDPYYIHDIVIHTIPH